MAEDGRLRTRSECVYETLLLAYPKGFRIEYGRQLTQVFGDLCREEALRCGTIGLVALWARTLLDLAASALVERGKANGRGLLEFGGRVAGLKGLLVVNASVVIFAALFSLPGPGAALAGLLFGRLDSLGPLAPSVVLIAHTVYPLVGFWALVWVICYPERGLGRAAIKALFTFNALAGLLLLAIQVRGLVDILSRRQWVMENFGIDPLAQSVGAMAAGVAAASVYLLFAVGYGYLLRTTPPAPGVVMVQKEIGGRS